MSILTIDLDTADEIDVLYAIDRLNSLLQCDAITDALAGHAFDMAGGFDAADRIYPQPEGSMTWHRHSAMRDAHLRRFGMLSERKAA